MWLPFISPNCGLEFHSGVSLVCGNTCEDHVIWLILFYLQISRKKHSCAPCPVRLPLTFFGPRRWQISSSPVRGWEAGNWFFFATRGWLPRGLSVKTCFTVKREWENLFFTVLKKHNQKNSGGQVFDSPRKMSFFLVGGILYCISFM